jgi:ATP-dependent helicase/nuclease subunit A
MGVSWTREQQQVIDLRKRNILVSAAAGSGKTAVLVERIICMITDPKEPVDIDRLLIVTFTNAAAAEMRERISAAIEKALEQDPENEHLQRQVTLIHNAQITTIDSFCLYVIRNHFHEIDLEPSFRIGDEGELKLLREDVLDRLFEERYKEASPAFVELVDGYATGRSDASLRAMVLELFQFSMSYPWPEEWLQQCTKGYEIKGPDDIDEAVWIKPLVENIQKIMADVAELMEQALELAGSEEGLEIYEKVLRADRDQYREIAACEKFSKLQFALTNITYDRMPSSRGYQGDLEKLEQVKALRDNAKAIVKKISKQYLIAPTEVMAEQMQRTAAYAGELVQLALDFSRSFAEEKRRKNLVDFNDMEHFALDILVDRKTKLARRAAEEFRDTFEEIMIDEYQDSNSVQETILRAISREERGQNNIFMVGDVKQSIYRFRLARPELFMEKYDRYRQEDGSEQRIDLHKNFRSREEVLSFTNDVFYKIMDRDLGNVAYDREAALYPGAVYPKTEDKEMFAPEIILADSADELLADSDYTDKKSLEAKLVADRIRRMKNEQLVTDKKTGQLRPVRYSDIVILLRSMVGWSEQFARLINDNGIPAHTVSSTGYFSTVEVQTVLAMLRILDNPRQDIPMAAVLRSPVVGMTDEEMAAVRLGNREEPFHVCVLEQWNKDTPENEKLYRFYQLYEKMRSLVPDTPIHELIEILLKETGYGEYVAAMPAGERRYANLLMLVEKAIAYENTSYKGLFHFVRYIDELQKYDVDFGEADLLGENEDVVRIMSIHKSKGLEFPVVFVAGLGKKFNRRDVQGHMVLHPNLGMGLDCLDGKRRLKSPTIAKRAIEKQISLENLGEELRVLYVAMTRAKEKLILIGTAKDVGKKLEAGVTETTLPYYVREGANTYLDWILPAIAGSSNRNQYMIRVTPAEELVTEEIGIQVTEQLAKVQCRQLVELADIEKVASYEERFAYRYPYEADGKRKNKYSVSELKHRAMRERMEEEQEESTPLFLQEEVVPYVPAFVHRSRQEETPVNQGAQRGTAVHRVMECYRFAAEQTVSEQIQEMLDTQKLTPEMAELVLPSLIEKFVAGETGQRMKAAEAAGRLYREKPFVMGFTREELEQFGFGDDSDADGDGAAAGGQDGSADLTLIQGIIDVFWMEEDGIVLLDYKTDRVETPQQLVNRYAAQLALYGEALERIYNTGEKRTIRVKERLLYSFRLGCVIET